MSVCEFFFRFSQNINATRRKRAMSDNTQEQFAAERNLWILSGACYWNGWVPLHFVKLPVSLQHQEVINYYRFLRSILNHSIQKQFAWNAWKITLANLANQTECTQCNAIKSPWNVHEHKYGRKKQMTGINRDFAKRLSTLLKCAQASLLQMAKWSTTHSMPIN